MLQEDNYISYHCLMVGDMKSYFDKINDKVNELNKAAQNPFVKPSSYNPFESAFFQTYVWVEKKPEREIICKDVFRHKKG